MYTVEYTFIHDQFWYRSRDVSGPFLTEEDAHKAIKYQKLTNVYSGVLEYRVVPLKQTMPPITTGTCNLCGINRSNPDHYKYCTSQVLFTIPYYGAGLFDMVKAESIS